MNMEKLKDIAITEEDIAWVEALMGKDIHFDESRKIVIKSMDSIDIQAFPGSGKTTTLVAKLAILAKKWPFSHSGICVLSHTNVARNEIESRIGRTEEGQKLLSYPHFIGTLHSFFDTFISLPWLRSQGIHVSIIDTDYVKTMRWKMLSNTTKAYFNRFYKDEKICGYYEAWGNIDWEKQGKTRQEVLDVISKSQENGLFTFDEMLLLAQKVLNEHPTIADRIQTRFPLLFIDEAQDTNSLLWDLIHKVLPNDNLITVYQGFGDSNQAIYNYINEECQQNEFPRNNPLVLNESRRFDNKIANLANSVAVSKEIMLGTENIFSDRNIQHTIFLFPKEKAACVIDEFAQLVLDTFSDSEIADNEKFGCHVVGLVHKKNDDTPTRQFPKGIYDYWPDYKVPNTEINRVQKLFIDYFRIGRTEFAYSGDMESLINWISKGLCIIINTAANTNLVAAQNNAFRGIEKILPNEMHQLYRRLMLELAFTTFQTKEEWEDVTKKVETILELLNLALSPDQRDFLNWKDAEPFDLDDNKMGNNTYVYKNPKTDRSVKLDFGSIHSVKGRTHLATLVLETFSRTHNMKSILKYICGNPPKNVTKTNLQRLKCQYVAMSRATALLCLAIPTEFVDENTRKELTENGWTIKELQ